MTGAPMILLIDDERLSSEYYVQALADSGFDAVYCDSVDDAVATIDTRVPDLVLLDLMMPPGRRYASVEVQNGPFLTGLLLLREIRQRYPEVPIVVLTSIMESEEIKTLQESDRNLYMLLKADCPPFELVRRIERLLISRE